ncbi:FG-GAP repeat domain-containing protein [Streptomyces zaomyceticus]|uniref:FG-GAP repeat domain-containing protein n=1 Tax=Streptomyces zaomyceticus TaxID=68286 RepID=UPI00371E49E4
MRTAFSRRRLAVSVGVVLTAVTAASLTVPSASAAPAPSSPAAGVAPAFAARTAAPASVPFLASGGKLLAAGTTGFLSEDHGGTARWTRYADGVSKVIAKNEGEYVLGGGAGSDTVVVARLVSEAGAEEMYTSTVRIYDMATGAAPVTLDLSASEETHGQLDAVVGSTLLVSAHAWRQELKLIDVVGGKPTVRNVGDQHYEPTWMTDTLTDTAVARLYDRDMVVDLKTGKPVGTYQLAPEPGYPKPWVPRSSFLSPTHVGWTERTDDKLVLATAVRGQDEVVRTPLGPDDSTTITGGLLGDWFAWGATTGNATPWHAFSARSLKDGSTVELLDHATHATKGPDGTLLVLGVTAADGSGVFRVSLGADGRPKAELIASTGEPNDGAAPLSYVGDAVPATVDLDGVARARLAWKFSTTRADLTVEVKSKATGEVFRTVVRPSSGAGAYPDGSLGLDWAGEVGNAAWGSARSAPNGAYEWTVTARPWNGMPSVTASGTMTVARSPKAHDYDDDGAPDLIARDKDGWISPIATRWDDATGRLVPLDIRHSRSGWNVYDRLESVGDIAGSNVADLVTRDRDGVLWLHRGTSSQANPGFEPRVRIGGGWNTYTQLTGGSDLTGDGRADLVAVDKLGDLYLYRANGSTTAPFEPRKKIGHGWGIYNQLTATGQIGGGSAGDLVARDKDGVLWLYLGKGDGTFAPRTKIGGGWNVYADIVGIGDGNKDGRPDVYARTPQGAAFFYAGTGDWKAPFKPRGSTAAGVASPHDPAYNQVS